MASIAIVNNAYGAYLAGPTQITITTSWQRFKITGTLAGGQTGLWIVVRQYAGNGDNWSSGNILLWGACLQQGTDPKKGYVRTWAFQTASVLAGVACGPTVVAATNSTNSPFKVRGDLRVPRRHRGDELSPRVGGGRLEAGAVLRVGEADAGDGAAGLPLAARADSIRLEAGRTASLVHRSEADDGLEFRQARAIGRTSDEKTG